MLDDKPKSSAESTSPDTSSRELIPLPTDRPRSIAQNFAGQKKTASLPVWLTRKLSEVAVSLDTTFFVATCAAFFALLHRYSGLHHLVIGIPVSPHVLPRLLLAHHTTLGSSHVDAQRFVELFVNALALRIRCRPTETFRDLVSSVRHALGGAERDTVASVPVPNIAPADPAAGPFQVMFDCLPTSMPSPKSGLPERRPAPESKNPLPELALALSEHEGRWLATVHYSATLFDEQTIDRLLHHYIQLLDGFGSDATRPIGVVDMLTEAERQQILHGWNRTIRDYPRDVCLHQLFETQAHSTPERIALILGNETLTYGKLNQRANEVAHHLRLRGVGPDILVGLCVSRSFDMVVGILGILKAGGAYVPIDPGHPSDRNAFVLEDSACRIVLTQKALLPTLMTPTASVLLLDELPALNASEQVGIVPAVHAQNLAYVLYTSGSTGKPKGVQIEHRSVVNFLESMRREPGLTRNDVLLAVTTLSFDIAGLELHLPLTTGATVVLATAEVATDGDALIREIQRCEVTLLQATPATWRLMLAAGWKQSPRLKALCGGEAMPADLAAQLLPRCAELWNMYGPTETTIWSTCSRVTSAEDIHIGRPIDNTEIYILDANLQPVPIGHTGELLIGGDGLARGYLNRPELTAERFIKHPFKANQRLSRTGDLARFRPDGNIDCLGRLDFQVKIRGFRIELGEIENQLASHPEVKQSVVVAKAETTGDKRLVAFIVPRGETRVTDDQLLGHLRRRLPDYMLPASFFYVPSFPLTPNGKIDRKALLTQATYIPAKQHDDTVGPIESRVKAIFEKILGRPVNSRNDSFFDLGGHSLLAAELMATLEREFGRKLPLAKMLEAPSVAGLSPLLETAVSRRMHWNSLVPIKPVKHRPTLFLIHGAGGNVLLYRELAAALGEDVSVYGFQSQGLDGHTTPLSKIEEMAMHYLQELRTFQPNGPYYLAGYCMGGTIAYEMARVLKAENQSIGLVALLDTYNFSLVKNKSHLSFLRQKIGFHFENLTSMGAKDFVGYLAEKFRMAREAGSGKIESLLKAFGRPKPNRESSSEQSGPMSFLQEVNDQAALDFVPRPFPGAMTVFRPKKQYDFMPDSRLGWGDVVSGSLEVVELPVNPHAMLINPFAQRLGQELKRRILTTTN